MKRIFALIVSSVAAQAFAAEDYYPIVTCENDSVVIDVNANNRTELQLVARGNDILRKMTSAGFNFRFGQQEFLVRGKSAEVKQTSLRSSSVVALPGVFSSGDFKKLILEVDRGEYGNQVERLPSGDVALYSFGRRSGLSCEGTFDYTLGRCLGTEKLHSTYVFKEDFVFKGCRSL